MAVLVYSRTAEATRDLRKSTASTVEGSLRSRDGDRSKIELCVGRVDHWWVCALGEGADAGKDDLGGELGGGGINDQGEAGLWYESRKDAGEVMVIL